jgi:hypothetical protein
MAQAGSGSVIPWSELGLASLSSVHFSQRKWALEELVKYIDWVHLYAVYHPLGDPPLSLWGL